MPVYPELFTGRGMPSYPRFRLGGSRRPVRGALSTASDVRDDFCAIRFARFGHRFEFQRLSGFRPEPAGVQKFPESSGGNMKSTKLSWFARNVRGLCGRGAFQTTVEVFRRIERRAGSTASMRAMFSTVLLMIASSVQAQTGQSVTARLAPPAGAETAVRVETLVHGLPLSFEANTGKFDRRVKFVSRGKRQNLFLTNEGMVLTLDKPGSEVISIVRLEFQDMLPESRFEGVDRLPAITNYFSTGLQITDVPNFSRVRQLNVYPGVDALYYGSRGRIEYDLIVSPGADTKRIKFKLSGHSSATVVESGDLR